MCYSGKCKYEGYEGSCTLGLGNYPQDAGCNIPYDEIMDIEENNEILQETIEDNEDLPF